MIQVLHKGRNLNMAQRYENAIYSLHPRETHSVRYVADATRKRNEEISRRYAEWSEANPEHTREAGRAKYKEICETV